MILVYLDESGNSGTNLLDTQQPVFTLAAVLVPEEKWLAVENGMEILIERLFPNPRPADFEIHANEIISGRGFFRGFSIAHRLQFLTDVLAFAKEQQLRVVHRAIVKARFAKWLDNTFGSGVLINPHLAAFPLVAHVVNDYLKSLPGSPLGIFISDENRDIMLDVEKAQKLLRGASGRLHLNQIIEKGFFIDSKKSLLLQLADLCAYCSRRLEEQKAGFDLKPIDISLPHAISPLLHQGVEPLPDVLAWLESEQKRSGQGQKPRSR
jgi:hypothetical protein